MASGALGLLFLSTGCSPSSSASPSPTTTGAPGSTASAAPLAPVQSGLVTVSARDNEFVAPVITVTAGSKIVWRNIGRNDHNIVAPDGTPFHVDAPQFGPKASFEYVADTPGTYRYYCSIHGTSDKGMTGTVQVIPS